MITINTETLPIKSWCNPLDEKTIDQSSNLANHPKAFKHIALMPDAHLGYGMPIGGVLACDNAVIPNAVGVDICCGMTAVRTSMLVDEIDLVVIKNIFSDIRRYVPLGFKAHRFRQDMGLIQDQNFYDIKNSDSFKEMYPVVSVEYEEAQSKLGTLGSGNHFIEFQKGSDGHVWYMIHSGSRNIGKRVADYHNKIAKDLTKDLIPKQWQLAFLELNTKEAEVYLNEMNFCFHYAKANRKLMSNNIKRAFTNNIKCRFFEEYDIHHNFVRLEKHFGKKVMLHRKGAISAKRGELGIIPGSQGTASYIVRGKGNPESFMSCSHGAGRIMSRKKAIETLSLKEEISNLNRKGILHSIRSNNHLDEAPAAYKNIDHVMSSQEDLVEIQLKLEPIAVIKG